VAETNDLLQRVIFQRDGATAHGAHCSDVTGICWTIQPSLFAADATFGRLLIPQ